MSRPKIMSDEEVLALAFPVISREGFESFTLEQVSEATGLAPATLIRRFKTKKRLAFLSRDWKWNSILTSIEGNNAFHKLKGLDGFFTLIREIAKSIDSKQLGEHMKLLAEDSEDPKLRQIAANYFQWTRDIIKNLLKQAVKEGSLTARTEPEALSLMLEALIQGSIIQFAFLEGRIMEKHLLERMELALKPYVNDKWNKKF